MGLIAFECAVGYDPLSLSIWCQTHPGLVLDTPYVVLETLYMVLNTPYTVLDTPAAVSDTPGGGAGEAVLVPGGRVGRGAHRLRVCCRVLSYLSLRASFDLSLLLCLSVSLARALSLSLSLSLAFSPSRQPREAHEGRAERFCTIPFGSR